MHNRLIGRKWVKKAALFLCVLLGVSVLTGCGKSDSPYADAPAAEAAQEEAAPAKAPEEQTAAPAAEAAETSVEAAKAPDAEAPAADTYAADPLFEKSEGVMTHEEYMSAELNANVVIETFVQAKQALIGGKASIYTQDPDGGYFLYEAGLTDEAYQRLVPGQKIRVRGTKSEYSKETEILNAVIEPLDGFWKAEPEDVTALLGTRDLVTYQNCHVRFSGMTVEPAAEGSDEAFLYRWDGSGKEGDDLYFNVSKDGQTYTFTIETMLSDSSTQIYKDVQALKVGDVVDMEGYLYWYLGPSPHIISLTKAEQN